VIAEEGRGDRTNLIPDELGDLDEQAKQLKSEVDFINFEANTSETKIISADVVRENFKVFKDV